MIINSSPSFLLVAAKIDFATAVSLFICCFSIMIAVIYAFEKIVQFCLKKLENSEESNEINELEGVTFENSQPTFTVMQNIDIIDDIISDLVLQERQRLFEQSSLREAAFSQMASQLNLVRNWDSRLSGQERADFPPSYEECTKNSPHF